MKKRGKDKKLLLVPSDLVYRLMEISNKQGRPFYGFVVEILEQALRVYENGGSIMKIADFYSLFDMIKSTGVRFVPDSVFNRLINKIYHTDRKLLLEEWFQFGKICGSSLKAKYENPIEMLRKFLESFESNLNEVAIFFEEGLLKVRCASPILSDEETELLASFIEGVMKELDYDVHKYECSRGIIYIEFRKYGSS